jgi:hypothetical protein
MLLPHVESLDASATPKGFGLFADFIRQDDIADGGAFDFTPSVPTPLPLKRPRRRRPHQRRSHHRQLRLSDSGSGRP